MTIPSLTVPAYAVAPTDTRTLAGEWLARLSPTPGFRNELTVRRLADAIGTRRFEDLFVLSLTNPELTEAQLSALAGSGPVLSGDPSSPAGAVGLHDALETSAIAQCMKHMHPDRDRCRRALAELEDLSRLNPQVADRAAGLCLFAAWVGGDDVVFARYVDRCKDPAKVGVVSIVIGAGQRFGWYPGKPADPKPVEEPAAPRFDPVNAPTGVIPAITKTPDPKPEPTPNPASAPVVARSFTVPGLEAPAWRA